MEDLKQHSQPKDKTIIHPTRWEDFELRVKMKIS